MTSSGPSIPPQLGVMASQPRSSMYLAASRRASSALASSRARCASAHAGGGMASSMVIRVSECAGVEMARKKKMSSRRIGSPLEFTSHSVDALLARLRRQGVVTGRAKPMLPITKPIMGRGRRFSEAVSENREDRVLSASSSPSGRRLP